MCAYKGSSKEINLFSLSDNYDNRCNLTDGYSSLVKVLSEYAPLVKSRASSFCFDGCELDDLIQEGNIGLILAYFKYNSELSSFSTFARKCIDSAIIDYLRKNNRLTSVPKKLLVDISEIEVADSAPSPEHYVFVSDEYNNLVTKAETTLSKFEFSVFSDIINGFSVAEIADKNEVAVKSIRNAVNRIRAKLK